MNVAEFIDKWCRAELTERSAAQQHFLDLCDLLDHPKPAEVDPKGEFFTFEKGATKRGGSDGWADVWKKGYFAWEYKGRHKDLQAAHLQLDEYRAALENPPLLVTCDMGRIVVHTNFTATKQEVHEILLEDLGAPRNLEILRAVFHAPHKLKPGATSEAITTEAARRAAEIAVGLRERGLDPLQVARFLDRVVFSLFAEDIGLLPEGLFTRVLEKSRRDPALFRRFAEQLFTAMAEGGYVGLEEIRHFNGHLFERATVLELTAEEIDGLYRVALLDWSAIDPSILGTLFERGLDPGKRSQLGAHYTSREDIETLVEPVVMKPLRREWREVQQLVANLLTTAKMNPTAKQREKGLPKDQGTVRRARKEAQMLLRRFHQKLAHVTVLDPACGSGNFLYVTLQKLKDLEKEVGVFALDNGFTPEVPLVGPWQLHGIEINPYAFELAQMTVWIGYLQWTRQHSTGTWGEPILRPMDTFECKDAILDLSDPDNPRESEWPRVDYIVGNPPFLGDKRLRSELGDDYVEELFSFYTGRVPNQADLCCYWFERARTEIERGGAKRAGLLATQSIRGGASREVLKRIKAIGEIFFAESDRDWIQDGATVHVSMVGFDRGDEKERVLDGREVAEINSNLTAGVNVTNARRLPENADQAFQGVTPAGPFVIEESAALELLAQPNVAGQPNSDVLRPYLNAADLMRRPERRWIVDFGVDTPDEEACLYEGPFEYVATTVKPFREQAKSSVRDSRWWLHLWSRHELRRQLSTLQDGVSPSRRGCRSTASSSWFQPLCSRQTPRSPLARPTPGTAACSNPGFTRCGRELKAPSFASAKAASGTHRSAASRPSPSPSSPTSRRQPSPRPPGSSTSAASVGSTRLSGSRRRPLSSPGPPTVPGPATSTIPTSGASAPSATPALSPRMRPRRTSLPSAPSPTSTTCAPPGSTTPTRSSTKP